MNEKLSAGEASLLEAWLQAHGAENDDGQYRKDVEAEFFATVREIKNRAGVDGFIAGLASLQSASDRNKNTVKD